MGSPGASRAWASGEPPIERALASTARHAIHVLAQQNHVEPASGQLVLHGAGVALGLVPHVARRATSAPRGRWLAGTLLQGYPTTRWSSGRAECPHLASVPSNVPGPQTFIPCTAQHRERSPTATPLRVRGIPKLRVREGPQRVRRERDGATMCGLFDPLTMS